MSASSGSRCGAGIYRAGNFIRLCVLPSAAREMGCVHRVPGGMAGAELVSRFKPREMEIKIEREREGENLVIRTWWFWGNLVGRSYHLGFGTRHMPFAKGKKSTALTLIPFP